MTIRCEGQTLGAIQGVRWCVDVRQEGTRTVEHLVCCTAQMERLQWVMNLQTGSKNSMRYKFLKLTWMRLLPQSATMMFPLASTATPVGALNWPFPSPWEPNLNRNSPSAVNTCRKDWTGERKGGWHHAVTRNKNYVKHKRIQSILLKWFRAKQQQLFAFQCVTFCFYVFWCLFGWFCLFFFSLRPNGFISLFIFIVLYAPIKETGNIIVENRMAAINIYSISSTSFGRLNL